MLHLCLILAGFEAYPSISEIAENSLSNMECGLPTQLSFSAREVSDGTFFKAIEDYDSDSKRLLYQLHKWVSRHTLHFKELSLLALDFLWDASIGVTIRFDITLIDLKCNFKHPTQNQLAIIAHIRSP